MTQINAAGYIRVSSKEQIEGESLSTQRQSIKGYCDSQGYRLIDIYADEGISGGSIKERHALLQCLHDGQSGKFNVLVIHRLSRFGRNARELLNNHEELSEADIQLKSISEGIDFNSKYGKAILGMLAIMAELEKDIIKEQMLENRIARARRGIPTSGTLPVGRVFDRKTEEWSLNEETARLLRWAADEYLRGASLHDLAEILRTRHGMKMSYHNLTTTLANKCGDTWTVKFKGEEPITYEIPRILDEDTIRRVRERLEHNRIECRRDVRKYVLTGFLRCEVCGKSLPGQTQVNKYGTQFQYYHHTAGKHEKCKALRAIPLKQIERAVFLTIFENVVDVPSFERAIQDSLPNERLIKSLDAKIRTCQRELKRIDKELGKLVDAVLNGTLESATIKSREQDLLQAKARVKEELGETRDRQRSMPDVERVKADAAQVRQQLLERFGGVDRLQEMTFDEKKQLLHWLFDGKDAQGKPYGIYVARRRGREQKVDYFMYGRITGLRTLKGDDINYQAWDEDEVGEYKGNDVARGGLHGLQLRRWG